LFGSKGTFLFLADGLIFFHNYFSLTITQVLFDVVPGIKFQDAIELVGMQPLPSTTAAWKRFITISAATFC
jgi:penicillin V acylase-like amidase (Ntn superfamily)